MISAQGYNRGPALDRGRPPVTAHTKRNPWVCRVWQWRETRHKTQEKAIAIAIKRADMAQKLNWVVYFDNTGFGNMSLSGHTSGTGNKIKVQHP